VQRHSIVPPGDYVLLTVTDSGQGIAAKHLAHIFEPFYTTKEAGKGTGLGLATVYGIVKQNGGFVWVYSEPGLGTTFKVYLPQVQSRSSEIVITKPAESSPRGCETLLLVEDEASVRQAARQFLTRMPRLGGPRLAERLADERPDMKVLFVSGYAENTILQHGKIDVRTRFLQKPFSLKTLARKVRDVLDANEASALTISSRGSRGSG
jgi:hypothetical protein